ncbi:DUF4383 domain-containing protein [Paeniglutamicibacter antarcticus]|uniref:DUF4383 domain-containing protein n=1 Tax=Arthrobacter terrae TaxID=2935737 RepID=A0A931G9E0_9MICC|nr:DUF4383 domain-containing protein [Arthrobacter terrae]MBG0741074.1 DUF4383 domain-containing protein [Arthrobacter terrae]
MTTANKPRAGTLTNVQKAALAVGVVFLLVGVLGFIPGITSQYNQLSFAGHESEGMLLGLFQVSVLHNIVHLIFGVAGIASARIISGARSYLLYGGIIYLVLWIYGLVIDQNSAGNFVPLNGADNWLHLFLGVGMIALALLLTRGRSHNTTEASTASRS